MTKKKVKIIERKLGREGAVGLAHFDENLVEIDPRQDAYEWMETIIHERMHLMFPKMSEKQITIKSHDLAKFLWDLHFRRTYNK
jgi:hypothetical protein